MGRKINIKVEFNDTTYISIIANYLQELKKPQIVLWYIGCRGLKKSCVEFYKDNVISPVLQKNIQTTFWLTDLTAWNSFKTRSGSIDKFSSFCSIINSMEDERIRCLKSSDIFKRMSRIHHLPLVKILKKDFIREASFGFPKTGICVKDIFLREYPLIMKDWLEEDTNKAYAAFQFLEGCLIVEEITRILLSNSLKNSVIEVVFLLPNNELKYYQDDSSSFQKSLELLISELCRSLSIEKIDLYVYFFSFYYGKNKKHRPYNTPGKVLNKKDLLLEDVIGSKELNPIQKESYATSLS